MRSGLLVLATLCGLVGACGPSQHVGRPCDLGTAAVGGSSGQIATSSSPALECPSRICLLAGQSASGTGALCTAACESNEDCADGETAAANDPNDQRCRGGFACIWPATVGALACKKLCVCTDFLSGPESGFTKPTACP